MCLEGGQGNERGYAMAALLVSLAVMMVLMSVAMPVWKTHAQREKEAELIFRGEQIARGINLYMRKMGGASYPPSLDVLVQGRFLRKKYKDPMTENDTSVPMNQRGEWDVINAAGGIPGGGEGGPSPQQQGGRGRAGAPGTGLSAPPSRMGSAPGIGRGQTGMPGPSFGGQTGIGGMMTMEEQAMIYITKGPDRITPFFVPMFIPDIAAGHVSIRYGLKGPNFATVSACASSRRPQKSNSEELGHRVFEYL